MQQSGTSIGDVYVEGDGGDKTKDRKTKEKTKSIHSKRADTSSLIS